MGPAFIDTATKGTPGLVGRFGILNFLNQRDVKHRLVIVDEKWIYFINEELLPNTATEDGVTADGD